MSSPSINFFSLAFIRIFFDFVNVSSSSYTRRLSSMKWTESESSEIFFIHVFVMFLNLLASQRDCDIFLFHFYIWFFRICGWNWILPVIRKRNSSFILVSKFIFFFFSFSLRWWFNLVSKCRNDSLINIINAIVNEIE